MKSSIQLAVFAPLRRYFRDVLEWAVVGNVSEHSYTVNKLTLLLKSGPEYLYSVWLSDSACFCSSAFTKRAISAQSKDPNLIFYPGPWVRYGIGVEKGLMSYHHLQLRHLRRGSGVVYEGLFFIIIVAPSAGPRKPEGETLSVRLIHVIIDHMSSAHRLECLSAYLLPVHISLLCHFSTTDPLPLFC